MCSSGIQHSNTIFYMVSKQVLILWPSFVIHHKYWLHRHLSTFSVYSFHSLVSTFLVSIYSRLHHHCVSTIRPTIPPAGVLNRAAICCHKLQHPVRLFVDFSLSAAHLLLSPPPLSSCGYCESDPVVCCHRQQLLAATMGSWVGKIPARNLTI